MGSPLETSPPSGADSSDLTEPGPWLLARLRRGDSKALGELYDRFGQRVYRIARGMLAQDSDAEDVTQEVFLKVHERAGRFEGRARFSTWLHRLTVNHCLNRIERERLRRATDIAQVDPIAEHLDPAESSERADREASLASFLDRLSPEHRAVLVLRELEELSYAQIAEVLEIPVGTVMSRLARARERLLGSERRNTETPSNSPAPGAKHT